MSDNVIPEFDRADQGSLQGIIRTALNRFALTLENCLPATIISYDRASNRAAVQPSISVVKTDGTTLARAPIASIPVFSYGGGGFVISMPLVPGSKGWIKTNDRDISLYSQSGKMAKPNTRRSHSFSDAVFYPDVSSALTIGSGDESGLVIQSIDGTVKFVLLSDKLTLTVGSNTIVLDNDQLIATVGASSFLMNATKTTFLTPLFEVGSAAIHFTTTPVIGPL